MTTAAGKRSRLIWVALALTLAATAWMASTDESAEALAVPARKTLRVPAPAAPEATNPSLDPDSFTRAPIEEAPAELFATEQDVAPEAEMPQTPVKPTTPAFPFVYAGKMIEEGQYTIFLSQGERNLALHAGEVIDGVWRIQSIQPPTMVLTYLPLKTEVSMAIGEKN